MSWKKKYFIVNLGDCAIESLTLLLVFAVKQVAKP